MRTFLQVSAAAVAGLACLLLLPVVVLTVAVLIVAWSRGWSPTRARWLVVGSWLLPFGVWLAGSSPADQFAQSMAIIEAAQTLGAAWPAWVPLAPWLVPVGLTNGAVLWAVKWGRARSGIHRSPRAAGVWAPRQFKHAMARARREARRAMLAPLTTERGDPVLGRAAMVSEAGAGRLVPHDPRLLKLPLDDVRRHVAVIGEPGAGKTVMLLRLAAAWQAGTWLRHVDGAGDRPLLILAACKGGPSDRELARDFLIMCSRMNLDPARVGWWAGDGESSPVRFDLWALKPERLIEVLCEMVRSDHPYYADIQDELVALAVLAPGGPPNRSDDFCRRLSSEWLLDHYGPDRPGERESIKQNAQAFAGIAARYRTTFRRIGRGLDSGQHLDDFDALVVTLEGTSNARTAAAQAQALVELVTDLAANPRPGSPRRRVLFIVDEFSAVSDRVDIALLMERSRSLNVAVIPAAQSWTALGPDDDSRRRLLAAAAGGWIVMATMDAESVAKQAGTQVVVETGLKKVSDGPDSWGDEGTGRAQQGFLVDPDRLRSMAPGEAAVISHGLAWWGVVTPSEVTQDAPALVPGRGLRRAIEARTQDVVTRGDRIPVRELEAGLAAADAEAGGKGAADAAAAWQGPAAEAEEAVRLDLGSLFDSGDQDDDDRPVFPQEGDGYPWPRGEAGE